jgi:hypothetical protein
MFGTSSGFKRVMTPISGTVRQNSLFHFVHDYHKKLACLKNYNLKHDASESRTVLYLESKNKTISEPAFRGVMPTKPHLSIDLNFSREAASHAVCYGPVHYTVPYGDFRLHIYFNEQGDCIDYHVKNNITQSQVVLTDDEILQITAQAKPIAALIKGIMIEKQHVYGSLNNTLFALEEQLSKAKSKVEYIKQADKYLETLDAFNRYSHTHILQQGEQIQRLKARFEEDTPVSAVHSVAAASEPEALGVDVPVLAAADAKQSAPPQVIDKLALLKTELSVKTIELNQLYTEDAALAVLVPLILDIESLHLEITIESNASENKAFLKKQAKKALINKQMLSERFEKSIQAGDLLTVQADYPALVGIIPMASFFQHFIQALPEGYVREGEATYSKQLDVSNYLNAASEVYQNLFSLIAHTQVCADTVGYQYSFLTYFFLKKNLPGFKMLLDYGVNTDADHLTCHEVSLNALQTIVCFYKLHPELAFVAALLAHHAPMSHTQHDFSVETRSLSLLTIKDESTVFMPLSSKQDKRAAALNRKDHLALISVIATQNHAFRTASELYRSKFSEILLPIAQQTDMLVLLEALSALTNQPYFMTRFQYELQA